jgi:hypothetical protein
MNESREQGVGRVATGFGEFYEVARLDFAQSVVTSDAHRWFHLLRRNLFGIRPCARGTVGRGACCIALYPIDHNCNYVRSTIRSTAPVCKLLPPVVTRVDWLCFFALIEKFAGPRASPAGAEPPICTVTAMATPACARAESTRNPREVESLGTSSESRAHPAPAPSG